MQTFLPDRDMWTSVRSLDYRRLGKQRVEVLQILNSLRGIKPGWANHPATKMWRGHEYHLALYGMMACYAWRLKGYKDTCFDKIQALRGGYTPPPPWLGDPALHLSHRSNLLRKDPAHYRKHWPRDPDNLPYVWPC